MKQYRMSKDKNDRLDFKQNAHTPDMQDHYTSGSKTARNSYHPQVSYISHPIGQTTSDTSLTTQKSPRQDISSYKTNLIKTSKKPKKIEPSIDFKSQIQDSFEEDNKTTTIVFKKSPQGHYNQLVKLSASSKNKIKPHTPNQLNSPKKYGVESHSSEYHNRSAHENNLEKKNENSTIKIHNKQDRSSLLDKKALHHNTPKYIYNTQSNSSLVDSGTHQENTKEDRVRSGDIVSSSKTSKPNVNTTEYINICEARNLDSTTKSPAEIEYQNKPNKHLQHIKENTLDDTAPKSHRESVQVPQKDQDQGDYNSAKQIPDESRRDLKQETWSQQPSSIETTQGKLDHSITAFPISRSYSKRINKKTTEDTDYHQDHKLLGKHISTTKILEDFGGKRINLPGIHEDQSLASPHQTQGLIRLSKKSNKYLGKTPFHYTQNHNNQPSLTEKSEIEDNQLLRNRTKSHKLTKKKDSDFDDSFFESESETFGGNFFQGNDSFFTRSLIQSIPQALGSCQTVVTGVAGDTNINMNSESHMGDL